MAAAPSPSATPTPSPPRGGGARFAAPASLTFDTFDALATGEPAAFEILGRTHSRLVQWSDFNAATMEGDLARGWEQPDATTWVFHLRDDARWHDREPLNGRAVVAADVAAHCSRAIELAASGNRPQLQRAWDWTRIRRVTAPEASRVVFDLDVPDPFLPNTLAGRPGVVQAPGAVAAFADRWETLDPVSIVGSGPFVLDTVAADGSLVFSANPSGHRRPLLDGVVLGQPGGSIDRFRAREIDEVLTRDRRDAAALRREFGGEVRETARFEDSPIMSTFFVGAPPWNNAGLRRALGAALNRGELARRLFGGRAAAAGPVAPVFGPFAPSGQDLAGHAGYRASPDDDRREARALWEAAGGPALGQVTVDFPSIFDPLYSASSVVVGMLNETLGPQFRPAVEAYTTISARARDRQYGSGRAATWFGWGPPFFDPEPSRYLLETYHSAGPEFAASGFRSATVDGLLDRLATEFDRSRRIEMVRSVSAPLLDEGGGGVLNWLLQRPEVFRWSYLGGRSAPPGPFWEQHLDAFTFLDPGDPALHGRPGP